MTKVGENKTVISQQLEIFFLVTVWEKCSACVWENFLISVLAIIFLCSILVYITLLTKHIFALAVN